MALFTAKAVSFPPFLRAVEKPQPISSYLYALVIFLLVLPAFIYYKVIYENAYNFPVEDDFNSALSFISDYTFGKLSVGEKLKLIFSQYNEHRIVFDRLIFLTDYNLFGELNFRHLILIGNLSLVLICLLFYKAAFRQFTLFQKLVYLLPVAYSLFLFQYWELSTWSMAALQNLYVIPFAMLSLYKLTRFNRTDFVLACAAAVLATYTSGNGLFTFLAGAPLLLFTKSYRRLAVWLIVAALAIAFYFWGYIRPPYHPDVVDSLLNHTGRAIRYFFTLTGMLLGPGRPTLNVLFGALSLLISIGLVGYLWYAKRLVNHLAIVGWLLFLYLTCLSLMATRSGMGIGQAATPRYGIVVVMLFATQSVLALETVRHHLLQIGVFIGYLGIALLVYVSPTNQDNRRRIEDRTRELSYSTAFYNADPAKLSLHWGNQEIARSIFFDALQKGIYHVPATTFSELTSLPQPCDPTQLIASNTVTTDVTPYETGNFLIIYRATASLTGTLSRSAAIQIIARSESACYAIDTQRHAWDDPDDKLLGRRYSQPGFSCIFDKKALRPGHYALWLCVQTGSTKVYKPLKVSFTA
ncbi:hypothetical protein WBJ53_02435 [Spirosoma sp. SC4-14]|uniref:hypothetical protein n=1 Tax=Spirosoma sp. SC4-14 TaxID=3128900 RepID=UPI0030CBFF55